MEFQTANEGTKEKDRGGLSTERCSSNELYCAVLVYVQNT